MTLSRSKADKLQTNLDSTRDKGRYQRICKCLKRHTTYLEVVEQKLESLSAFSDEAELDAQDAADEAAAAVLRKSKNPDNIITDPNISKIKDLTVKHLERILPRCQKISFSLGQIRFFVNEKGKKDQNVDRLLKLLELDTCVRLPPRLEDMAVTVLS